MWQYTMDAFDSSLATTRGLKRKSDNLMALRAKDGWELVSFQCAGALSSTMIFVFKRFVEDDTEKAE